MQNIASPYGCRDDVSATYRERVKKRKKERDDNQFQLAELLADLVDQTNKPKELAPSLPADFESSTVLPGDRESPEPPLIPESSSIGGKKGPRRVRTRSTNVSEHRFVELPTVLRLGSEMTTSLPGDRKSPEPQSSHGSGATEGRKVSRKTRTRSTGGSELRSRELPTILRSGSEMTPVLPGDRESPKPPLNSERGVVEEKKKTRRVQFQPTGAMECISGEPRTFSQPGSKAPTSLTGNRKLLKPQSSGALGGSRVTARTPTRSTGESELRSGERQRSRTTPELKIEDRLGQISLSSLPENRDLKSKNKENP
ncbi:hypothetical protein HNY73_021713 [Argiope bruennichi]|uniref:Uncharacterized protein n=1 Tax=Argiope bruennichi TaxID=94029 RepID=A0A8T0E099_ARGBR|nr:hypothetical protein HNY73_021713 [Argiope bruennichi]